MFIVSVCMITYNHRKFIKKAIDSIMMQNANFDIELIIGDDCSTDNTRAICEEYVCKYKTRIKLLDSCNNIGMMRNFIKTLNACNGKYVALCEGDDYWIDPHKLQKQVDFLENNKEYSICFHDINIEKNGIVYQDYITKDVSETTCVYDLSKGNYIHTVSVLFRNNLFNNFPESFSKVNAGDYYLHMLNAKYGKIYKIKEIMAVYRVHENGVWNINTNEEKKIKTIKDYILMYKEFKDNKIRINFLLNIIRLLTGFLFLITSKNFGWSVRKTV